MRTARYIIPLEGHVAYDACKDNFSLTKESDSIAYAKITTTPSFTLKIGDGEHHHSFIDYDYTGFSGKFLINCANHKPYVIFTPVETDHQIILGGGKNENCHHHHEHHDHEKNTQTNNQIIKSSISSTNDKVIFDNNWTINCIHNYDDCIPENHGLIVNPATDQNADFYIHVDYIADHEHHHNDNHHHDYHNHHNCGILETSVFNVAIPLPI